MVGQRSHKEHGDNGSHMLVSLHQRDDLAPRLGFVVSHHAGKDSLRHQIKESNLKLDSRKANGYSNGGPLMVGQECKPTAKDAHRATKQQPESAPVAPNHSQIREQAQDGFDGPCYHDNHEIELQL